MGRTGRFELGAQRRRLLRPPGDLGGQLGPLDLEPSLELARPPARAGRGRVERGDAPLGGLKLGPRAVGGLPRRPQLEVERLAVALHRGADRLGRREAAAESFGLLCRGRPLVLEDGDPGLHLGELPRGGRAGGDELGADVLRLGERLAAGGGGGVEPGLQGLGERGRRPPGGLGLREAPLERLGAGGGPQRPLVERRELAPQDVGVAQRLDVRRAHPAQLPAQRVGVLPTDRDLRLELPDPRLERVDPLARLRPGGLDPREARPQGLGLLERRVAGALEARYAGLQDVDLGGRGRPRRLHGGGVRRDGVGARGRLGALGVRPRHLRSQRLRGAGGRGELLLDDDDPPAQVLRLRPDHRAGGLDGLEVRAHALEVGLEGGPRRLGPRQRRPLGRQLLRAGLELAAQLRGLRPERRERGLRAPGAAHELADGVLGERPRLRRGRQLAAQ